MVRSYIYNVDTKQGLKPVKFWTIVALEFWIGLDVETIRAYTRTGRFPKSPFIKKRKAGMGFCNMMLYTDEMIKEAIDLYERYYPPYPRLGNPLKKALYRLQNKAWKDKVLELENKWKEGDYLERAPATPKPLYVRKRKHENQ